jgi:hypothetical protein
MKDVIGALYYFELSEPTGSVVVLTRASATAVTLFGFVSTTTLLGPFFDGRNR